MYTSNQKIIILGGGIVGLSIAYQLIERKISKSIIIIEKEKDLGLHTSGRNSGVLHAGIYYEPGSLRAKVSVDGAKRLREWVEEEKLEINHCGKVIVPTKENLDIQLDKLAERGRSNGAKVELLDKNQLNEIIPEAISASGRALWSPNTSVINPKQIINKLECILISKGVKIKKSMTINKVFPSDNKIRVKNEEYLTYDYLFNCTGLQADKLAHLFNIGKEYTLLPFKGIYWQLKESAKIKIKTNLYPVPDLSVPFLGVHFTPGSNNNCLVSIGPTASPAWGRENYSGMQKLEPSMAIKNLGILANQYITNRGKFRQYVHQQSLQSFQPFFLKAAQELIPSLKQSDIEISKKVGIRAQLFNLKSRVLENDFICLNDKHSTHILNSISPAFTASFSLADLIINKSNLSTN